MVSGGATQLCVCCMLEPALTVTTHLKSWSRKVPADITGWLSPACGGGWTWMSSNLCFSALSENQPTPATQPALSDIIHRRGEGYKYWFEPHGITQLFSGDPNIPGSPSQQSGARLHTIIQNIIQYIMYTQTESKSQPEFRV